jgi:hypothetical protein
MDVGRATENRQPKTKKAPKSGLFFKCAEGGTRTRMRLPSHAPETCASTSSTTSAGMQIYGYRGFIRNQARMSACIDFSDSVSARNAIAAL